MASPEGPIKPPLSQSEAARKIEIEKQRDIEKKRRALLRAIIKKLSARLDALGEEPVDQEASPEEIQEDIDQHLSDEEIEEFNRNFTEVLSGVELLEWLRADLKNTETHLGILHDLLKSVGKE